LRVSGITITFLKSLVKHSQFSYRKRFGQKLRKVGFYFVLKRITIREDP